MAKSVEKTVTENALFVVFYIVIVHSYDPVTCCNQNNFPFLILIIRYC